MIRDGSTGICRARQNIGGELYTLNYGEITSMALDPIEKKPLYRFYPGSMIFSVGTFGCNFKCSFCQNWSIAHDQPETLYVTPQGLVSKALELKASGNIGIAYTYNEPSIWYEYVYDCARLAREKGLLNVLVTNGYISPEPLEQLLPYTDAMNIDVKAYTLSFYSKICGGKLESVNATVEKCVKAGVHVELTTLVIPGLNDSLEEIEEMCRWISGLSEEIPLHLSRFFPNYRMLDRPPTPRSTLENARKIAQKYLKYVYLGNVW